MWNRLPDNIRNIPNSTTFKENWTEHFFNHQGHHQNIRSKSNWYYHQLCVVYIYIIVKLLFYVIKITIVTNGVKHFEFELSPESHPDTQSWKRRYESYDLMDILGGSKRVIIYISNTSGCPGIFLINSLIPFLFIPITPTTTGNVLVFICHMQ